MNIHFARRVMMMLQDCSMFLEIGIMGVTLASLLSHLGDKQPTGDYAHTHRSEIVMTATSLTLAIIAFGITMLGAGDTLGGLKLAGNRIGAVGKAALFRVFGSSSSIKSLSHRSERSNKWHPGTQSE
jgi:hypothetical protein